jgi:hypothetical protein
MKKVCACLVCGFAVLSYCAAPAHAVMEFKKQFDAKYVEGNGNAKFVEAAGTAKCNICHDANSKSKKDRNEYGRALSTLLKKDNFKADRISAEPDKVKAEILEAFKKVEEMKAASGKSFGDIIKAGALPGGQ